MKDLFALYNQASLPRQAGLAGVATTLIGLMIYHVVNGNAEGMAFATLAGAFFLLSGLYAVALERIAAIGRRQELTHQVMLGNVRELKSEDVRLAQLIAQNRHGAYPDNVAPFNINRRRGPAS